MNGREVKTANLILAFAIAPLCPVLIAVYAMSAAPALLPGTIAITMTLSYIPTLVMGPPFIRLLRKRNRLTSPAVILSSMCLGVVAAWVTLAGMVLDSPDYMVALFQPVTLFFGSLAGILYSLSVSIPFCIIARISIAKPYDIKLPTYDTPET